MLLRDTQYPPQNSDLDGWRGTCQCYPTSESLSVPWNCPLDFRNYVPTNTLLLVRSSYTHILFND